mmetsp:Transcript_51996/g.156041  ORF Transcript_51996/g.156041 Transcript_51996/m.156041 type:complete len:209 (-) Transcript_51996:452-1078(-)
MSSCSSAGPLHTPHSSSSSFSGSPSWRTCSHTLFNSERSSSSRPSNWSLSLRLIPPAPLPFDEISRRTSSIAQRYTHLFSRLMPVQEAEGGGAASSAVLADCKGPADVGSAVLPEAATEAELSRATSPLSGCRRSTSGSQSLSPSSSFPTSSVSCSSVSSSSSVSCSSVSSPSSSGAALAEFAAAAALPVASPKSSGLSHRVSRVTLL